MKNWILKIVMKMVARGLEAKFPGLATFIEALLNWLENGTAGSRQRDVAKVQGAHGIILTLVMPPVAVQAQFSATELKRD